jgi:hypothetical protein
MGYVYALTPQIWQIVHIEPQVPKMAIEPTKKLRDEAKRGLLVVREV